MATLRYNDTSATAFAGSTGTSFTSASFDAGSGSNRALAVGLSYLWSGTAGTLTVTYGGVTLSAIAGTTFTDGDGVTSIIYGITATGGLPTGSNTLTVSGTQPFYLNVDLLAVTGADQTGGTTTFAHATGGTGNAGNPNVTVTSATGNLVFALGSAFPGTFSGVVSPGTLIGSAENVGITSAAQYANGAASVATSETLSSGNWSTAAVDIAAAASAAAVGLGGSAELFAPALGPDWRPRGFQPRLAFSAAPVSVTLTGVSATAAAGTPTVTGIGNVTLTGVNATAAAGTITISGKANFTLTGVSATTAVNVPTITAAANVTPTGVVGTTAVNIPTVTGFANVTLSGVNATGQAGDVTISVGGAINVTLTGVAATAAVGTPTITGFANVTLTGIAATAQIGTLTTSAAANASVTGVAATSAVNTPTVTGLANVTLSGVLATVAAGDITVSVPTAVSVNITGVSASASAGTVTTNLDAVAGVTFGGGASYSQREFDRIIRLDYEEWKRKHKKNKKLDKAVEEAIEVLEEVAVRGLLDDLAPAIELKETIEALPTEPKAIAAVIEDIREQTRVLERMLDEDEDDIMLMIWALD